MTPLRWLIRVDGRAVGEVVADPGSDGSLMLSWKVDEKYRNRGLATSAARRAIAELAASRPGVPITALIRPWNGPSLAVARKIGMTATSESDLNVSLALSQ